MRNLFHPKELIAVQMQMEYLEKRKCYNTGYGCSMHSASVDQMLNFIVETSNIFFVENFLRLIAERCQVNI